MPTVAETDMRIGRNRPEKAMGSHRKAKRKLVDGVSCPRCQSDAIYRYGKTANGRKRYLCQVCRRQFSLNRPERLQAQDRPSCPLCRKPMHVYMRNGDSIRFRCSDYPDCRTFLKRPTDSRCWPH